MARRQDTTVLSATAITTATVKLQLNYAATRCPLIAARR